LPGLDRAALYAIVVRACRFLPDGERRGVYDATAAVLGVTSADAGAAVVEAHPTVLLSDDFDWILTRIITDGQDRESERELVAMARGRRLSLRT
jgi:hypothetical protein